MDLFKTASILLLLFCCHVNRNEVFCQTTEPASLETVTSSPEPVTTSTAPVTTSTAPVTTSTAPVTTSTEPETGSTEHVTTEPTSKQTTEPQTTVPPTTTGPPLTPKHYSISDGNETCLVMDAAFQFTIPYTKKNDEEATAVIDVPTNATYEGNCKKDNETEELDIVFFGKWLLTIDVGMEKNEDVTDMLMADENVKYAWKSVTLTYYVDDKHFPDAKDVSDQPQKVTAENLDHVFEASTQGSYKCAQAQNIELENVTLAVSDFQYKAFGTTDSEDYPDHDVAECPHGKKDDKDDTGKIVGIVVGSVVGGILLITIVGCLIQRSRKRGSYEKV